VTISWKDGYGNPYLENNKFLEPMKAIIHNGSIDYTLGNISTTGTINKRGITKYQYQIVQRVQTQSIRKRRSIEPLVQWIDIPGVADQVTVRAPTQGQGMTFWVRGQDLMGNTVTDFAFVRTDNTAPAASNLEFEKNVPGPRRGYFSRLVTSIK
jgi:hypothetical protein